MTPDHDILLELASHWDGRAAGLAEALDMAQTSVGDTLRRSMQRRVAEARDVAAGYRTRLAALDAAEKGGRHG